MDHLANDVGILRWKGLTSDLKPQEIAAFWGASVIEIAIGEESLVDPVSIRQSVPNCTCLIIDAETLARAAKAVQAGSGTLSDLVRCADRIFVYGFEPSDAHRGILPALSSGGILDVRRVPTNATFCVGDEDGEGCGQFAGLRVGGADPVRDFGFVENAPQSQHVTLIRVADQPFLVRLNYEGSIVYLSAARELANLEDPVSSDAGLLPWFSRFVPLSIFLRGSLGDRLWHSAYAQACFIFDDPLLRLKYGFLEYSKLFEMMRSAGFSACIAFIPWNYRRSSKTIAGMCASRSSPLSICVHGCDHTRGEFDVLDFDQLRGKAQLALERMRAHTRMSGLPFDDVMVFPQGLFSSPALRALETCGYLAAVNTSLRPTDTPNSLTLRDLLDVAVTTFGGVPLFARHYPRDAAEFAFDLFLGKPAFIVEHHGYFRNGYGELQSFAKRLNELDRDLEWNDLGRICARASLQRVAAEGHVEVKFYTDRFLLANRGSGRQQYVLFNPRWPRNAGINVLINGCPWNQDREDDCLRIRLALDAGARADIQLLSENSEHLRNASWKPSGKHKARVLIRRVLSEVRDNQVETNRFFAGLLTAARKLRTPGGARG